MGLASKLSTTYTIRPAEALDSSQFTTERITIPCRCFALGSGHIELAPERDSPPENGVLRYLMFNWLYGSIRSVFRMMSLSVHLPYRLKHLIVCFNVDQPARDLAESTSSGIFVFK